MAISTLSSPVNYNMATQLGAHTAMLALHGHLSKIGLSRVMTGDDYDLGGDETQISTTYLATTSWLAYNFTDAEQSNYPITVWFRIVRGRFGGNTAGSETYAFQYRVSEGVSAGAPLGANFETFDGIASTPGGGTTYASSYSGSWGDYFRYDGNSLTIIMAANGWYNAYNSYRSSLLEMHIERRYSILDGSVGRGFCGWFSPGGPTIAPPPQWATGGISYGGNANTTARATAYVSSSDTNNIFFTDAYSRPTTASLTTTGGAAVVMPVMFLDQNTKPTTAMKLFTAPLASFTHLSVVTLDFSGEDKKYFVYRPVTSDIGASIFAYLIEWE